MTGRVPNTERSGFATRPGITVWAEAQHAATENRSAMEARLRDREQKELKVILPPSGPGRLEAESGWDRSLPSAPRDSQASLLLAARTDRAKVRVRSTDVLRDKKSFLVAWGMAMTRLVLLVVDYLCHVIVHFSCMYEVDAGRCPRLHAGAMRWGKRIWKGQLDGPRGGYHAGKRLPALLHRRTRLQGAESLPFLEITSSFDGLGCPYAPRRSGDRASIVTGLLWI